MSDPHSNDNLTEAEKEVIRSKLNHAVELKQSRVLFDNRSDIVSVLPNSNYVHDSYQTGGGFFLEDTTSQLNRNIVYEKDEEFVEDESTKRSRSKRTIRGAQPDQEQPLSKRNAPEPCLPIPPDLDKPVCDNCSRAFDDSFLCRNFDVFVCDSCKDPKVDHSLITKSTAKERYLLNDGDLDIREPVLKFILKQNPHNHLWGDMRLYLEAQVAERSLEIWGSEEALDEERERRAKRNQHNKLKSYDKKIKALKQQTRSSLYVKKQNPHQHTFGEEQYDSKTDSYYRLCTECNYKSCFEKL